MKILVEDAELNKPIFMNAIFYTHPARREVDLLNNEAIATHKVVVESENWPPKDRLELMFVSSSFDLFGKESFVIEETTNIKDNMFLQIRVDEDCFETWNVLLENRDCN